MKKSFRTSVFPLQEMYTYWQILLILSFIAVIQCTSITPYKLWPLAKSIGGKEVLFKEDPSAKFIPPTTYANKNMIPNLGLGYGGLQIDGTSVNVTLDADLKGEFMVAAFFYWDPRDQADFFYYKSLGGTVEFHVYAMSEKLNVEIQERSEYTSYTACGMPALGWYTIAMSWTGSLEVFMIANDGSKKTIQLEMKDVLSKGTVLTDGGDLRVGPISNGIVCCLSVYKESLSDSKIVNSMTEACNWRDDWKSTERSPCVPEPCVNKGRCNATSAKSYECICRRWNTGKNCSERVPMARQGFMFVGTADPSGILDPMSGGANMTVRSQIECGQLCLRENMCLSFAYTELDNRCTLYDDFTQEFSGGNSVKYFIERSIFAIP